MNLIDRYKKPTPKFFKTLRNIGIVLGSTGAAILAAPVAIPAVLLSVATYLTIAGTIVMAVSQAVVSDPDKDETKSDVNNNSDDAV
ncbi:hypothetical protein EI546_03475 [Aequorivita sp. H23M31]|uniref:Uncharacterized protein n=1 Tax=Aequorivita ciconiae TaxID=2494375 RepID=A0A410G0S6_9FLAO|nr:hypothetical protein [Aequorivita sp. H23M31]QAA80845.1 hypothetical protein EI546_03475 [Aequorivita sp. H23M31]